MARRHSLLVRLLAVSVLIATCSIAATAWLAAQTTTVSIEREQGDALATDATIYDSLLGYAATHTSWAGVQPTVDGLAKKTGRRIALTTASRKPVADSVKRGTPELPVNHTAVVDPLAVDQTLKPGLKGQIDPRAVGPYRLTEQERRELQGYMVRYLRCVQRHHGIDLKVTVRPNGRPVVEEEDLPSRIKSSDEQCGAARSLTATATERAASGKLMGLLRPCLKGQAYADDTVAEWERYIGGPEELEAHFKHAEDVISCIHTARRQQLVPHVAPPALLFLTRSSGKPTTKTDLSAAGTTQITLAALAVLAVTVLAAWFAAGRLVRPIRAVTTAAQRMGAGDRAVRVKRNGKGELGQLADAFNAMSERLEATESQRKDMVSDIAHELRTPLGNIRGWLEATQDGVAKVEPELISSLLEEAVVLQYLIDDLQDLALADAGKLRLHPEPIDVTDLVDQVAAAHQARAEEGGVILRAATRGRMELTADPARLRQALGNLVANAVRYTPRGGEVTVTARRQGESILLEVADTGVGIGPEELPHVFDRFWRADKSRSRKTGGSGLGLAITRHLAEAHGGTASATSVPGKGSTFSLLLPLTSDLSSNATDQA
jgi:two-component system, OmpR family, sensor histidine kinase BaeS